MQCLDIMWLKKVSEEGGMKGEMPGNRAVMEIMEEVMGKVLHTELECRMVIGCVELPMPSRSLSLNEQLKLGHN